MTATDCSNGCTHPKAFYAYADGLRTREAMRAEVVAWVVGQKHPLFSMAAPNFLCFDSNVRVGAVTIARETVCTCPTNQPYMD
jgi:hypothetical protein